MISNFLAQTKSLAFGKTLAEVEAEGTSAPLAPHRVFEGNRPANVFLAEKLTPFVIGSILFLNILCNFQQRNIDHHP